MLAAICVQSGSATQTGNSSDNGKLPIEEGAIPRDGFTLHYRTQGTGKPIVLLSGGPGLDIDYYLPVAKFFPPGYKLVFLEQRGTGRSRPEKLTAEKIFYKAVHTGLGSIAVALATETNHPRWTFLWRSAGDGVRRCSPRSCRFANLDRFLGSYTRL